MRRWQGQHCSLRAGTACMPRTLQLAGPLEAHTTRRAPAFSTQPAALPTCAGLWACLRPSPWLHARSSARTRCACRAQRHQACHQRKVAWQSKSCSGMTVGWHGSFYLALHDPNGRLCCSWCTAPSSVTLQPRRSWHAGPWHLAGSSWQQRSGWHAIRWDWQARCILGAHRGVGGHIGGASSPLTLLSTPQADMREKSEIASIGVVEPLGGSQNAHWRQEAFILCWWVYLQLTHTCLTRGPWGGDS